MKTMKAVLPSVALLVAGFSIGAPAFAADTPKNPAEVVAEATGMTVDSVWAERTASGKRFGQIAADNGALEQFKSAMLVNKKARVQERVADGRITQEQADQMVATMEEHQANCDGTGAGDGTCGGGMGMGQGLHDGSGMGAGMGAGSGQGLHDGSGMGAGRGQGGGQGLHDGSCLNQ